MKVSSLAQALSLDPVSVPSPDNEISGAYAGDLLSWVMGRAQEGNIWVTIMTNINVVAVASLFGASAVVVCDGCEISDDIIETANSKFVNIYRSQKPLFETCTDISALLK